MKHFSNLQKDYPYRKDIDGLRAVAVIAVIIGHANGTFLPSGFLGVDVFFVISGFVITNSLMAQSFDGIISFLSNFYIKRIKRILPALLFCVILTSIFVILIDPSPRVSIYTGIASLIGISNFLLYFMQLDYFATSIKFNTFTHTWSLGVEEQFYFLFPLIIFYFSKRNIFRNINSAILITLILSMASLISFIALQHQNPSFAYYMMPSRFWEIGTGALLALLLHSTQFNPTWKYTRFLKVISYLILALLISVFFLPENFMPLSHIAVVTLTAMLIFIGTQKETRIHILTNPISLYLGLISYSLYLWHWPLLALAKIHPESIVSNFYIFILATVIIATFSYLFIEQPIRNLKHSKISPMWVFVIAIATVSCTSFLIYRGMKFQIKRESFAFAPLPNSGLPFNPTCVVDNRKRLLKKDTFDNCTFPPISNKEKRMVWVFGDSHAGHLQGLFISLYEEFGFGFHLIETPGYPFPQIPNKEFEPRTKIFKQAQNAWKAEDIVVLSRLYLTRNKNTELREDFSLWLKQVDKFVKTVEQRKIKVILIGPPPMFNFEDIRGCSAYKLQTCNKDREQLLKVINNANNQLDRLAKKYNHVSFLNSFSILCPEHLKECSPYQNGKFIFRDRDHLNVTGAKLLQSKLLQLIGPSRKTP